MPVFSIVMPVYNVENEIRQCLDSIVNQTFTDFEVLCVDDCGTDSSVHILEEYAQKDARFKIFHHEKNKGVAAARNTALDHVQGKYLIFVDSDDWLELNMLERIYQVFQEQKTDMVSFQQNLIEADGKIGKNIYAFASYGRCNIDDDAITKYVGVLWNKAYDYSKIKDLNIRFPEGLIIEDSEYTFKVLTNISSVYDIEDALYNYRNIREGSYTNEDKINQRCVDRIAVLYNCYHYLVKIGKVKEFAGYIFREISSTVGTYRVSAPEYKLYIFEKLRDLLIEMDFPKSFDYMRKRETLWFQ